MDINKHAMFPVTSLFIFTEDKKQAALIIKTATNLVVRISID